MKTLAARFDAALVSGRGFMAARVARVTVVSRATHFLSVQSRFGVGGQLTHYATPPLHSASFNFEVGPSHATGQLAQTSRTATAATVAVRSLSADISP